MVGQNATKVCLPALPDIFSAPPDVFSPPPDVLSPPPDVFSPPPDVSSPPIHSSRQNTMIGESHSLYTNIEVSLTEILHKMVTDSLTERRAAS